MKQIAILFLLVASGDLLAQSPVNDSLRAKKVEYFFQLQTGALVGCNSCGDGKQVSFSSAFSNGVKIGRKLRVGAGFGLDSYFNWNLLPVFGMASWDLIGKKNVLFVDLNFGNAIAGWRPEAIDEYGYTDSRYGNMYSYSIGYRIKYEQMRIAVGVGQKTQFVTSYYEYPTYYWRNNNYVMGEPGRKEIKNEINRLAVWLSIGWK
jgi:hypothetical protein